ncbi:Homeodomain-like protein [Hypoxylon sp. FL1857]|nr:Homeodomain-like protein [Hypoxylon sp. FL1857]
MPEEPLRRGPWSQREDELLKHLVGTQGALNWVRISHQIGTRSPKQCRERYHQNLKPTLNHDPITPEEGATIEMMVDNIGRRWAEIARSLTNRSDNAVKNWWNGSMNRRKRQMRREAQGMLGQHRHLPHYYAKVPDAQGMTGPPMTALTLPPPVPASTSASAALPTGPPPPPQRYSPTYSFSYTSHHGHHHSDHHHFGHHPHHPYIVQDCHACYESHRPWHPLQSPSWNNYSGLPSPSEASPRAKYSDRPVVRSSLQSLASRSLCEASITLPPLRIGSTEPTPVNQPLGSGSTSPAPGSKYSGPPLPSIDECFGRVHSQLPTAPSSPYYHSPRPPPLRTCQLSMREKEMGHSQPQVTAKSRSGVQGYAT